MNATETGMSDAQAIFAVTTAVGTLADRRDWSGLRRLFADSIEVGSVVPDGGRTAPSTPDELVGGWQASLTRYYATQHMLTNHSATIIEDEAGAVAYFQATHCKPDGTLWILGGRYDYRLQRTADGWRICALTMTPVWSRDEPNRLTCPS